jgi:hypothetical protein
MLGIMNYLLLFGRFGARFFAQQLQTLPWICLVLLL